MINYIWLLKNYNSSFNFINYIQQVIKYKILYTDIMYYML